MAPSSETNTTSKRFFNLFKEMTKCNSSFVSPFHSGKSSDISLKPNDSEPNRSFDDVLVEADEINAVV